MCTIRAILLLFTAATCLTKLSQHETNGASLWGTLDAPTYPKFLADDNAFGGFPWGERTAVNTNPYKTSFDTGVTRKYTFDISRDTAAPDGYQKNVILINGQFPGPLIEANWGDMIEVTVTNNITGPNEGTAIHWHGFLQRETPWYDGVPSVTQCPIVPGGQFTYTFKADLFGTSWYHSHYSAQYAGGLFGPIVIHGPAVRPYDIDLGPISVSDWYHKDYFSIVEAVSSTDPSKWLQYSDNNLISGKMTYDCSLVTDETPCDDDAGISKFKFQTGKSHLLRLINPSAAAMERFTIDGHKLTVVANDFVPVVPYEASYITLAWPADGCHRGRNWTLQRIVWMRSNISEICNLPKQPHALAVVYYEDADTDAMPTTAANYYPGDDGTCTTDPLEKTIPFFQISSPKAEFTQTVEVNEIINSTGHLVWTINNSSAHVNYNNALYLLAHEGNISYPYNPQWNVYDFFNNASVRLAINNLHDFAHPIHLHGHNMQVLHEGPGRWDGSIVRPSNPQRRDTQMLRAFGHMVIQYETDNPGAWALHCHIAWHVSMGFYMTLMERPLDIARQHPPQSVWDTCRHWNEYTEYHLVNQIDSGV